ncbi:MAG: carbohydrate esterase [Lachnospiraceae bacterium]|nr:carbohydrate esterase [Lachnospiraceae bacterium]
MQNTQGELPQICHTYVAADGGADYTSVQAAIDAVPLHNSGDVIIHIRPGVYEERIEVSGDKPWITLAGEGDRPEDTIISFAKYAGMTEENGDITTTFRTATVNVYANHFKAENLSIVNSYDGVSGGGGRQALALYASGEQIQFENCVFRGLQDTVYAKDGSQLYHNCYIEGDVDFIFGGARAVFEQCEIHSINVNPEDTNRGGYIAAPSTPAAQKYGFLFDRCVMTGNNSDNTVFLGRPWHPGSDPMALGNCVFMHCELGSHIREDGWKSHMGGFLSKNARLYEFENKGPGAAAHENRRQLTPEQAQEYTKSRVLGW